MAIEKEKKLRMLREYEAFYHRRGQREDLEKIHKALINRGEKPLLSLDPVPEADNGKEEKEAELPAEDTKKKKR